MRRFARAAFAVSAAISLLALLAPAACWLGRNGRPIGFGSCVASANAKNVQAGYRGTSNVTKRINSQISSAPTTAATEATNHVGSFLRRAGLA